MASERILELLLKTMEIGGGGGPELTVARRLLMDPEIGGLIARYLNGEYELDQQIKQLMDRRR